MRVKSRRSIGSWPCRAKLGLELLKYFLDRLPRGFVRFGLQHAPVALDVEAGDLKLVHDRDPELDRVSPSRAKTREFADATKHHLPRAMIKSVGCPTLRFQLFVNLRHTGGLLARTLGSLPTPNT